MIILAVFVMSCRANHRQADVPRAGVLYEDQILVHDGVERRYHLYASPSTTPKPLVLLLHGGGGTIDNHIGLEKAWPHQVWLDIADREGLHVVVPQGENRHWKDCRAECTRCGTAKDSDFLLRLLDTVAEKIAVDPDRIFVTGESNGGFMAQRLAQEAPERFAGIGVAIALMSKNSQCTPKNQPMSVMYQVGTRDAAIRYDGGEGKGNIHVLSAQDSMRYWHNLNQCESPPSSRKYEDRDTSDKSTVQRIDYECPKTNTALSLVTMEGAGHVAPSIEVQVSGIWERIAGIQNHDIEGAEVFWDFFKHRTRRAQ